MGKTFEKELMDVIHEIKGGNSYANFFIGQCMDSIEEEIYQNLKIQTNYIELIRKIDKLKREYPRVKVFFEDKKIVEFTQEELRKILDIINLYDNIVMLEKEEIFKIGLKTGILL